MSVTTLHTNKPTTATSSQDEAIDTAVQFLAAADDAVSNYLAQFQHGDVHQTATKSHPILVAEVMRAAIAIHLQTGKKRRKSG